MNDAPAPDTAAKEVAIRQQLESGDVAAAASSVVRLYGPELLGYLHAVADTPAEADDVFGDYCERLMRGLEKFRGDSSLRTWSYRVARNLLIDRRRCGARTRKRGESPEELSKIAAKVRTQTATFLQTEVKDRLAEIRAGLPEEDQTLLILRIDRDLPWSDVAAVMLDTDDRAARARLRKRFERLVARLRAQLVES
jgi:RNA polymerase sigma-70 factor (ECF subfamily)